MRTESTLEDRVDEDPPKFKLGELVMIKDAPGRKLLIVLCSGKNKGDMFSGTVANVGKDSNWIVGEQSFDLAKNQFERAPLGTIIRLRVKE